jgi:flagellar assembly factor FliW
MFPTASAMSPPNAAVATNPAVSRSIVTRFGELAIDEDKLVTFIGGLYGLEQHRHYILTKVPDWPEVFNLLQAVDDPQLSLIVLPLEGVGGPIDPSDFAQACRMLAFDEKTTIVLGIVTMRAQSEIQGFTVNLKAPLLIDTERRQGRQHVFASERYDLRHPLAIDKRPES